MRALCAALLLLAATQQPITQTMPRQSAREMPPAVREYAAPAAPAGRPIVIDGRLDDAAWASAPWSEAFVDIEGDIRAAPRLRTRVKMAWDSTGWYVGAELEEPDLWATIRERDAVIFHDNDFELFVDPDGDTHRYFELEVNALATAWDLFLPKPYRDGGQAVNAWDIAGLVARVSLDGTLNDSHDRDRAWSVELAIPWSAFSDSGRNRVPPRIGDTWRVNFSRVEWDLERSGEAYTKRLDAATGKATPEHNWVWSPQQAVNMHMPEMWGRVRFAGPADSARGTRQGAASDAEAGTTLTTTPGAAADDTVRWALRRVYYAQRDFRREHGAFAGSLAALGLSRLPDGLQLAASAAGWEASAPVADGTRRWHIRADGLVWRD